LLRETLAGCVKPRLSRRRQIIGGRAAKQMLGRFLAMWKQIGLRPVDLAAQIDDLPGVRAPLAGARTVR
jgi:hypothetical protein